METAAVHNNFKKAMSAIMLTAGATLADAERRIDRASTIRHRKPQQDMSLVVNFCQLLIQPVNGYGPCFAQIPGFAETYCREHLSVATNFLRQAMATHEAGIPQTRRLIHIA